MDEIDTPQNDYSYLNSSTTNFTTSYPSQSPTQSPTLIYISIDEAEEIHGADAYTALVLQISLIICIMFAYCIKIHNFYYLSER